MQVSQDVSVTDRKSLFRAIEAPTCLRVSRQTISPNILTAYSCVLLLLFVFAHSESISRLESLV